MKNNYFILVFLFLFCASTSQAESTLETFYRKTYEAFSGQNCDNKATTKTTSDCPVKTTSKNNTQDLKTLSENQFFNRLGTIESKRLQCGEDYWKSLTAAGNVNNLQNQDFMIKRYEEAFPILNDLKSRINKLTQQNIALDGQMSRATNPKELEAVPSYVAKKKEYDDRAEQIVELKKTYELAMSQIPHSDIPEVRDFIEEHAGPRFFSKDIKKIEKKDFEKLTQKVLTGFQKKTNDLNSQLASNNFPDDERERMATDGYLIGELSKESPDLSVTISKYQCLAENRQKGKSIVTGATTAASFLIPGGAFALAKVSRAAFLLKYPKVASGLSSVSRMAGYASMVTNSYNTYESISTTCLKKNSAEIKGVCTQTPKTILQQKEIAFCIMKVSMQAASAGVSVIAKRLADRNSELSKFVENMKGKLNSRNQNLPLASTLDDAERLAISEMILDRDLSPAQKEALLKAHNIGKGFGQYSAADIEAKRNTLRSAGFSRYEAEILLWKGLAGKDGALTEKDIVLKATAEAMLLAEGVGVNVDKNAQMIAAFQAAAKSERACTPISKYNGGVENATITASDITLKSFSSSPTIVTRVRGGDFENIAEDISAISDTLSKRTGVSMPGSVAGKPYDYLIKREMNSMASEAEHAMSLSKNLDYSAGQFEAWQFMRARTELVRYNMNQGKMNEADFDKALHDLDQFISTNKLQNKVRVWEKAENSLKGI